MTQSCMQCNSKEPFAIAQKAINDSNISFAKEGAEVAGSQISSAVCAFGNTNYSQFMYEFKNIYCLKYIHLITYVRVHVQCHVKLFFSSKVANL